MIRLKIIVVITALSTITSCALKKHFPNKEKDYQYRKEIPTLVIPDDLKLPKFQPPVLADADKANKIEPVKVTENTTVETKKPETIAPTEASKKTTSEIKKVETVTPIEVNKKTTTETKKAETIIPAKVSKKTTTPNVAPKETIKPAATTREETDREEETVVMVDMVEGSTAQPASSNLKSYSYDEPTIVTPQSSNLKNYSYDEPVVVTPPSDTTETEPEIKVEPPQEPAEIKKPFYVDFIMFDAGATRLRTNQKFTPIWRLIGKSLSHNHIEITQRNRESGQFIIQYDPDRKDYNDDSVSDEFWFVFSDNNANEKEFRIRVISYNKKIEILVLDESNTPLSDGTGLKILKLIFNTLHSALSAQK